MWMVLTRRPGCRWRIAQGGVLFRERRTADEAARITRLKTYGFEVRVHYVQLSELVSGSTDELQLRGDEAWPALPVGAGRGEEAVERSQQEGERS